MKKKSCFVEIIGMALMICFFAGCATSHYGQLDSSVPVEEQCLVKIPGNVKVWQIDGKDIWQDWLGIYRSGSIAIPTGTHTFQCYSVSALPHTQIFTDEFKAGNTYRLSVNPVSKAIVAWEDKEDEPGSVIVAPERYFGMAFGKNMASTFAVSFASQIGAVIDGDKLTTGLFWDLTLGMGIGPDTESPQGKIGVPISTGISAEFYLPGTSTGLGVGAGVTTQAVGVLAVPYIRATAVPFKRVTKLKVYFDYYLTGIELFGSSIGKEGDDYFSFTPNKWGLGISYF